MKPLNLESFFLFIKNISILKNLTDFRKTAETGVDPRLQINLVPSVLSSYSSPGTRREDLGTRLTSDGKKNVHFSY